MTDLVRPGSGIGVLVGLLDDLKHSVHLTSIRKGDRDKARTCVKQQLTRIAPPGYHAVRMHTELPSNPLVSIVQSETHAYRAAFTWMKSSACTGLH